MGRSFTVNIEAEAVSAAIDLYQIEALTTPITVLGLVIGQSSDVGDAAAEALDLKIRRITDDVTNVEAENNLDTGSSALTADIEITDTTQLTTGAATVHADVWYIQMPYIWIPPPEMRIVIPVNDAITVTLSAPADAITLSSTIYLWQEGA